MAGVFASERWRFLFSMLGEANSVRVHVPGRIVCVGYLHGPVHGVMYIKKQYSLGHLTNASATTETLHTKPHARVCASVLLFPKLN